MAEPLRFGFNSNADPQFMTVSGPTGVMDEAMQRTGLPLDNGRLHGKIPLLTPKPAPGNSDTTEVTIRTDIIGRIGETFDLSRQGKVMRLRASALQAPHLFMGALVELVNEGAVEPDPTLRFEAFWRLPGQQREASIFDIQGVLREPDVSSELAAEKGALCMANTAVKLRAYREPQEPSFFRTRFRVRGDFSKGLVLDFLKEGRARVELYAPHTDDAGQRHWRFKSREIKDVEDPLTVTAGLGGIVRARELLRVEPPPVRMSEQTN